jgi:hypothetical protein
MNQITSYELAAKMLFEVNSRCGSNTFSWKQIEDLVDKISLKFSFHDLVILGYIQRVSKGNYQIKKVMPASVIMHDLREMSMKRNALKSAERKKIRRQVKMQLEKSKEVTLTHYTGGNKHEFIFNEPAPTMTVEQMIAHLKSLGYKIMKPIQNYEEI